MQSNPKKPATKGMVKFAKFLFIFLAVVVVIGIVSAILSKDDDDVVPAKRFRSINKDSLIAAIKKDSLYHVTKVEITVDSTINIHVNDPEKFGTDDYFNKTYHILDTTFIQEIAIYKKDKFQYGQGYHTSAIINRFKENNIIGGQCSVINERIKQVMNDPGSFEHVKTDYHYIGDGRFAVNTQFRGKNAFNAIITNEVSAIMTADGNILKFSVQ